MKGYKPTVVDPKEISMSLKDLQRMPAKERSQYKDTTSRFRGNKDELAKGTIQLATDYSSTEKVMAKVTTYYNLKVPGGYWVIFFEFDSDDIDSVKVLCQPSKGSAGGTHFHPNIFHNTGKYKAITIPGFHKAIKKSEYVK